MPQVPVYRTFCVASWRGLVRAIRARQQGGLVNRVPALESSVGWRTKRRIKGKLVLAEINSIDAGLRNLKRSAPLETVTVDLPGGRKLKLPTVEEMLRIKAGLHRIQGYRCALERLACR